MILDYLIHIATTIITSIVILLPSADPTLTAKITEQTTPFRNFIIAVNWFFPVDSFFFILQTAMILTGILVVWLIGRYIAHIFTMGAVK